uniref:Uncharacterized protein n=1 Tax=Arundo donax TaxID=35708 RepID=A0A0A9BS79_ARUDO
MLHACIYHIIYLLRLPYHLLGILFKIVELATSRPFLVICSCFMHDL